MSSFPLSAALFRDPSFAFFEICSPPLQRKTKRCLEKRSTGESINKKALHLGERKTRKSIDKQVCPGGATDRKVNRHKSFACRAINRNVNSHFLGKAKENLARSILKPTENSKDQSSLPLEQAKGSLGTCRVKQKRLPQNTRKCWFGGTRLSNKNTRKM